MHSEGPSQRTNRIPVSKLIRESVQHSDEVSQFLAGLNELSITSKLTEKIATAQLRGIEVLAKVAQRSKNAAVDDVMQGISQLFRIYAEKQIQFSRDFENSIQQLRKVADTERRLEDYEKAVQDKSAKLRKVNSKLDRDSLFWKKSESDFERLRIESHTLDDELRQEHLQLISMRMEAEVLKMSQFRQGMMGIADAYSNLAATSTLIFGAQREITQMVPEISTQNVDKMYYDGVSFTHGKLEEVRHSLRSQAMNQRPAPISHTSQVSFGAPAYSEIQNCFRALNANGPMNVPAPEVSGRLYSGSNLRSCPDYASISTK